jgi:superfamily II DNA or RNA helicase
MIDVIPSSSAHLTYSGSESAVRQIEGRIVRTPQNKPVSIYRLVTKHTIDETIERVIREKVSNALRYCQNRLLSLAFPPFYQTNMDSLTYSELESNLSFINAARI